MQRFLEWLDLKNPSPNELAMLLAALIAICSTSLFYLFSLLYQFSVPWYGLFLFALLVFYAVYTVSLQTIHFFIYRRIKLIYKIISKAKLTKDKAFAMMHLDRDILKDVEDDVRWSLYTENQELEHMKRLEEYRKQFLGNVSHELKTPIFNAQGYIETLIEGGINDEAINRSYLEKAINNIDRLNAIVKDLEMISQIEDGKLMLEPKAFNIYELLADGIENLSFMAQQQQVSLRFKKGVKNNLIVKADKDRVRQVVTNLLTNAIKYNVANGTVSIGIYDMDEKVLVEISDTGIGIPESSLPRIFERFYRVDKSRSREIGGTGLGLSIVKHILEAHQQTLNVRSTIGDGSTFSFTLAKASR